jgi:hypothetical protein
VPFFGLATLWATFSKIWAIFSNLLVTLDSEPQQNKIFIDKSWTAEAEWLQHSTS